MPFWGALLWVHLPHAVPDCSELVRRGLNNQKWGVCQRHITLTESAQIKVHPEPASCHI